MPNPSLKQFVSWLAAFAIGALGLSAAIDAWRQNRVDGVYAELAPTISHGVERRIKQSTFDEAACRVDRDFFMETNPRREYVALVRCQSEYSAYVTVIRATRFGPKRYHWVTDGLQESVGLEEQE